MGLDMYLERKKYVKNWDHHLAEKKPEVTVKQGGKLIEVNLPVKYVTYEAAYWRKANQIHQWFVNNVQDGEDDCKEYWVSPEQLKELLQLVNNVLAASKLVKGKIQNGSINGEPNMVDGKYIEDPSVAKELLPTESGFFFGGTEYDEYYYQDLIDTREQLTAALADESDDDFYYSSSW